MKQEEVDGKVVWNIQSGLKIEKRGEKERNIPRTQPSELLRPR